MRMTDHIDMDTQNAVNDLLNKEESKNPAGKLTLKEVIDFYKQNYEFVQLVSCGSCGADLTLWVLDKDMVKANMHAHHLGLRRIELGGSLMSTRKRHDGVMGYECLCGANTLLSEIEKGIVPTSSNGIPADQPHIQAAIQKRMLATNFKPDVKEIDGHTDIEGFLHRRIK